MPGIENLNFGVVLNYEQFKKDITTVKNLASGLNKEVTEALNLKKKISDADAKLRVNAEKIAQAEQKTAQESAKTATAKAKQELSEQKLADYSGKTSANTEKTKVATQQTNAHLASMQSIMLTLSRLTGVTFGVVGIRRFLSSLIDITGQFEVQRMALRSMLQDIDAADKIYQDLYRFSSESTYRFSELAKYAKQLAAFNIPKEDLLETTKMLGDVASGVGVSMDRIILAYGHVKSSGFLRGIQLRSFSQNGVPILEELAKQFSEIENRVVSLGEVFDKMMKREIPFEMVEQAFKNMTSEGGKFYQMQEVLAKTLAGQINILKGRWENMLAAIGEANSGPLKSLVSGVSELISNYENVGKKMLELIGIFGIYKATVFLVTVAQEGLFAATFNLQLAMEKLSLSVARNPYAAIGVTITALITTLYKLGTSVNHVYTDIENIQKSLSDGTKEYKSALASENVELERLTERLRLAKKGTDEYDSAKKALQNRFSPYIEQLRAEGVEVSNLSNIYGDLAKKIEEANKQRFLESIGKTALSRFDSATKALEEDFNYTMGIIGKDLSTAEQYDLWNYIMGGNLYNGDMARYNKLSAISSRGEYNGAYSGSSYNHWYSVDQLRAQYAKLREAYNKTMDDAEALYKTEQKSGEGGEAEQLVYKISTIVEGIKKDDADIKELRKKAATAVGLTESEKQALDNLIADRKRQSDLYKDIMGVDYDKDIKKAENAAVKDLTTQLSYLEKLYTKYQTLASDPKITNPGEFMAKNIKDGHTAEYYDNLENEITKLLASLKALGKEGEDAAEAIEKRLGLDALTIAEKELKKNAKAAEDAEKAINKYLEALEKWTNKEKPMQGEGVAYQIGQAIANYKTEKAEAEQKYKDVSSMPGANGAGNILALLNMGRDQNAAYAKLRATVLGLIRKLVKEILEQEGYDLTNWNDKTLGQINAIGDALAKVELPDWIKDELTNSSLTSLLGEAEKTLDDTKKDAKEHTVDPELLKKIAKTSKYAAKEVVGLASSFRELGEATGNDTLTGLADGIESISEAVSSISDGMKQGDAIGAFLGLLVFMAQHFFKIWAEEERKATEATEQYTRALLEADSAYNKVMHDTATNPNTAFGGNALGSLRKQMELAKQYREHLMYYINTWKNDKELYSRYVGETGELDWQRLLADVNAGVILKDTYGLDEFKRNIEGIISAEEALKSTTEDLFGDLASSLADQFIANFKSMGNAVDDFGDTFENLGETILNSLLQSYIIENILKKYEAEANSSLAKYANGQMTPDEYAAWLDGFADNVRMESEALAPAINGLIGAFADRGLLGMDSETTNSLGSGIKSITEETASLLASYINAMRADLSYMRGLQERGWGFVELIGQNIPTLSEYLAQIAATNFDIAQSNQSILAEIQSVIGAEGSSGSIVRVQLA